MADYFEHRAPARKFIHSDPNQALKNLYDYLLTKPKLAE